MPSVSSASWTFRSDPQEVSMVRYIVVDFAWAHGVAEDLLPGVGVAVSEIVTNAIVHAYPAGTLGEIVVRAEALHTHVAITVADQGVGCDTQALAESEGAGLRLARGWATDVEFATPAEGTGLSVTLRFPRSDRGGSAVPQAMADSTM